MIRNWPNLFFAAPRAKYLAYPARTERQFGSPAQFAELNEASK